MISRYLNADQVYAFEGRDLQKIEAVAQRLDDPKTLTFDDRRDLANLLNLMLDRAIVVDT